MAALCAAVTAGTRAVVTIPVMIQAGYFNECGDSEIFRQSRYQLEGEGGRDDEQSDNTGTGRTTGTRKQAKLVGVSGNKSL